MFIRRMLALVIAAALTIASLQGYASQGSLVMPTVGPLSGLTFLNLNNAAFDALATCNSGATQPLNAATAPSAGQVWCDNSVSGAITVKQYDGSNWVVLGVIDTSTHIWTPPVGGGSATLASGATVDLGSVPQAAVDITGTTPITSFGSSAVVGQIKFLRFTGALTLTNNATSLILPANGNNIPTAAGDTAAARYLGGGNWAVIWYSQENGTALLATGTIAGSFSLTGAVAITLSANTNDWAPGATKSVVKLTVNNASGISITGIAAPPNDGNIVIIDVQAASTGNLTLVSQSGSSTAANRFSSPSMVVEPGREAVIKYDSTASRWSILVREEPAKAPTVQRLTSGSGATYTTPIGVTYLKVTMVAGGGGGGASSTNAGSAGAGSSFGSWTTVAGSGGAASNASSSSGGAGGTGGSNGTGVLINRINGGAGNAGGGTFSVATAIGSGGSSCLGGGGNSAFGVGGNAAANGAGGGGATQGGASSAGGGGAGECVTFSIGSPAATYNYTVGASGAGGAAGGTAGGGGGTGIIIVEEFYN